MADIKNGAGSPPWPHLARVRRAGIEIDKTPDSNIARRLANGHPRLRTQDTFLDVVEAQTAATESE
jgi:hypothetical protein